MQITNFQMCQNQARFFSLSSDKHKTNKNANNYESSFEDLLKEGSVSNDQQKEFEKRRQQKVEEVKKQQEDIEQRRQQDANNKEKAFEDLMSGKSTQITDDMNL